MTENIDHRQATGDIVVGMDDSPSSLAALRWATAVARSTGHRLRAVFVFSAMLNSPMAWTPGFPAMAYLSDPGIQESLQAAVQSLFDSSAPDPSWDLQFLEGPVGPRLVDAAVGAWLLVVGTREHVGLGRLVNGSVSHYCLSHAQCPVAAIPPVTADPAHRSVDNSEFATAPGTR